MNVNRIFKISVAAMAVLLAGCTSDYSGNRYDSPSIGEVQRTDKGRVISLRRVELKPENSMAGTALGAVGGGIVGSAFGGGHAKLMTATAGAIAGGVAGNAIATRVQDGIEYTIQLDNNSIVTIAQAPTPAISVGQRVHVVYSQKGRSRVVPE